MTQAGLAITGYGVGAVLAQLSGGLLTDRIGRRNAIAISMITSAALVLLLLQARSLPAVLAIVIVYSFFAELHRPASGALIADLVPPEHRVAAYAFNRLLFNLAFAIGLALGGLLAEALVHAPVHRRRRDLGGVRRDLARRAPPRHPDHEAGGPGDRRRALGDPRRQGLLAGPRRHPRRRARLRAGVLDVPALGARPRLPRTASTGSCRAPTASSSPSSSSGSRRSRCGTRDSR